MQDSLLLCCKFNSGCYFRAGLGAPVCLRFKVNQSGLEHGAIFTTYLRLRFKDFVVMKPFYIYIKMDLLEIGWGGVDWIGLAQDRVKGIALVNAVMNLRVP
jgi:hypothetical protein